MAKGVTSRTKKDNGLLEKFTRRDRYKNETGTPFNRVTTYGDTAKKAERENKRKRHNKKR